MENSLENSREEVDLLERNSKKVKVRNGKSGSSESQHLHVKVDGEEPRRKLSYREKLLGNVVNDMEMKDQSEEGECFSDEDSDLEEDDEDEECPNIRLSKVEKQRIRRPCWKTLILKVLGRRVGYKFLERRVNQLWNPKGLVTLANLGNDYYLARFSNDEDYDKALLEGPWMVADHYLIVQQWIPNFDPDHVSIRKVVVWARIPHLPIEYYDKTLLKRIGNRLGRTVKVDVATEEASRAKYARFSVEIDLARPLISKFRMRRRIWRVEYEGIHLVCFNCGRYGHKEEDCSRSENEATDSEEETKNQAIRNPARMNRPEVTEDFGPWMLVQHQRRRTRPAARRENMETLNPTTIRGKSTQQNILQGSRYGAITNIMEENPVENGLVKESEIGPDLRNHGMSSRGQTGSQLKGAKSKRAVMIKEKNQMEIADVDSRAKTRETGRDNTDEGSLQYHKSTASDSNLRIIKWGADKTDDNLHGEAMQCEQFTRLPNHVRDSPNQIYNGQLLMFQGNIIPPKPPDIQPQSAQYLVPGQEHNNSMHELMEDLVSQVQETPPPGGGN